MRWSGPFVLLLRLFGVLVTLLCMFAPMRAQAEQEPILLEYSAEADCPTKAEFERMVFERAHSARPANERETARLFAVSIRKTASGVQGSLTVREGGVNLVRRVGGKNCRQLATVLALAAALAIDPSAELASPRESEVEEPEDVEPTQQPQSEPGEAPQAARDTTAARPALSVTQEDATPNKRQVLIEDPVDEYQPHAPSVIYGEVSVGPRVELGATPYPAFGPHVTVGLLSANGRWRAQLGGSWLLTPDKRVGPAAAEFRILTANLSLCALALQWREHVSGGPCLHAEVGDLYGRGLDIDYRTTVHRMWSTAGAHIHLRVPASDTWFFGANLGANVLLNRYTFEFNEPDTEVFSQLAVTGSINVLAGLLF